MDRTSTPSFPAVSRHRGFTLIELVVVVAIVGVLAGIALPSFLEQMRKSRRSEATTEIFRVAQAQERWRASNPSYTQNLGPTGLAVTGGANATSYTVPSGYYTLSVTAANATSYTIQAAAAGGMSSDDRCDFIRMALTGGTVTYSSVNSSNVVNSAASNPCWNR
jgi:type IV pilus assembly protein PilE